ncbi:hemerythrin family protein [archaeon]|jgi:hemerythrin|nr:hemerythrin family protein [archaeon]MBT4647257.1 hemerythrin family protein [archaeon]MBT6821180.1 hemerythrin family protein [archaeon]MBT7391652.1 hemerythrin family protein [archaeon]
MLMRWKKEYSVKVKEIDIQHKKIFVLINDLNKAIINKNFSETLRKIIDGLVDYSIYHFETEEKYFKKFNFEYSDEHKKEHESFKKKITEIIKKIDNNEMEISFELVDFLEDWIINHVTGSDQKYIQCFQENGLK